MSFLLQKRGHRLRIDSHVYLAKRDQQRNSLPWPRKKRVTPMCIEVAVAPSYCSRSARSIHPPPFTTRRLPCTLPVKTETIEREIALLFGLHHSSVVILLLMNSATVFLRLSPILRPRVAGRVDAGRHPRGSGVIRSLSA